MPYGGAVRNHSPKESFKCAEGLRSCSLMSNSTIDELSMEEVIRRCCSDFSLNLIEEIRLVLRRGDREGFMHHRDSDAPSFASNLASAGTPLGNRNSAAALVTDDGDKGDGELLVQENSTMSRGCSVAATSSDALISCPTDVSISPESGVAKKLARLELKQQTRDINHVLRGARLSRLSRQAQVIEVGMRLRFHRYLMMEETLDFGMGVLVIVNLAQLGLSADCERDWWGWLVVDCFFAVAFLIEFLLKVLIRGVYEHLVVHWKGALFDGIIVLAALVELVFALSGAAKPGPGAQSLTVLRVVRLVRLVRIVKALRLPIFKDLLMMCEGLVGGSQMLFSSIILLMVPIYCSALLMRETVGTDEANKSLVKPFSSFSWSFFTTFRCIMGDCAAETGQPLVELLVQKLRFGWLFGVFYVGLILLTCLGLFNVIIALYVEQIVVSARKNESLQKQRRWGDVKRLDVLLAGLFHEFVRAKIKDDLDFGARFTSTGTGSHDIPSAQTLSAEEIAHIEITKALFDRTISTENVQNIMDQLGIPSEDRWNLFDILDADGSGSLQLGEVAEGLKKLRGEPRRSDIVANGLSIRAMQKRVHLEMDSIFTVAKRSAASFEAFRHENMEHKDLILDKVGALAELIGRIAKVMPTALGRSRSLPSVNSEPNAYGDIPHDWHGTSPPAQYVHRHGSGLDPQFIPQTPHLTPHQGN